MSDRVLNTHLINIFNKRSQNMVDAPEAATRGAL